MVTQAHHPLQQRVAILHEGSLDAEYTVVRSFATRDWVAVGTVRDVSQPELSPAWLLVGTGKSAPEAIADLQQSLVIEAKRRAIARSGIDAEM